MARSVPPSRPETPEDRRNTFTTQLRGKTALRMSKALKESPGEMIRAVTECANAVDETLIRIEQKGDAARANGAMIARIACKKGCAYCCYGRVATSVPEVIRIAAYILTVRSEEEVAEFVSLAKIYLGAFAGLSAYDRSTLTQACPFLSEDLSCSIHPVRPIACRRHHSLDVEACKKALDKLGELGVPQLLDVGWMTQPIIEGMERGAAAANLHPRHVDLIRGVLLAIESDASERWLEGEDSFAEAEDSELLRLATGL